MKHLRLAAWTVWFMLCWIALAHADPISAMITGIAGLLKAGGIAASLIKLAFGVALQIGVGLLRQALSNQRQPGITGQLRVGGDNSVSFLVGDYATAGSLEYTGEWGSAGGTPNAYHVQVITLSDLPQGGIHDRIWINGQQCAIDFGETPVEQGYPVKEYRTGGKDYMWVKILAGAQVEADPYLRSKFGSDADKPFLADMIGRGCTVAILTAKLNRKLLTQLPAGRFEPLALPLYDPRKDSTVGGEGAHRWGVQSTYEPTANNAVIIYNLLRGIWYDGELIYGPAIPAARLPLANWFAAMNECDLPVDGAPQFRGGYEVKIAEHQPIDVIGELLKGCNGRIAEVGGVYKIHVGAPALPAAYLTDDEFVVTEEQEFDPFPGLENTYNGATASYPDPEAGWEMKDAPQRLFPELEAEDDGRRLLAGFQFAAVPYPLQVQRLMASMVLDGRRFRKHRGTLGPWAFALEPLDTISWTSEREGYSAKLFQLASMDDQVNANQGVAINETDPADFDWNSATDALPWSVGPLVPQWPPAQPITGWQVQPAEIRDADGNGRRPSIEVRFDGDQEDVRAVRVVVRLAADQSIVFDGELPYGDPLTNPEIVSVVLNALFLPDTEYKVQGTFVPFSGRDTTPSAWLAVTTPNIKLGAADITVTLAAAGDDIRATLARIAQLRAYVDERLRMLAEGAKEVAERVADDRSVAVRWRDAAAFALSTLTAAISDEDGNLIAVAEALTAVQAAVGNVSADGLRRIEVQAGSGDVVARLVDMVRATIGDDWVEAGTIVEVGFTGGDPTKPFANYIIMGRRVMFMDDEGNVFALFGPDGLTIENARLGTLYFDQLQSTNGKLIIRGAGSDAYIEGFH